MSSSCTLLSFPLAARSHHRRISATISDARSKITDRPILPIPGGYGPPLVGPIKDRLDFHYFQGAEAFFSSRIKLHNSTVLRLNMPPGPFISRDSRVVALLDASSFRTLFDGSCVEKRDVLTGTYMPNVNLTGGHRMLAYLDPSEPKHALLKRFLFHLLASTHQTAVPAFRESFGRFFDSVESDLASKPGVSVPFGDASEQAIFTFLAKAFFGVDPGKTEIGTDAPALVNKWIFLQLSPTLTLGLPPPVEEFLLHTFPLPSFLVGKDYNRLYAFFRDSARIQLDEAERMGLPRDEACHNILFATCFNAFGGMKILFPKILKWVSLAGPDLHASLAREVRGAVASHGGGEVTMKAMDQMPILKSAVYEVLRLEPPVPQQYGRAKKDLVVHSHDAAFEVRKGELLFGYQPFATRDERVFERAKEFLPERFVGDKGERLLRYVVWSNGPETEATSEQNKVCAGKDFVVMMARLLLAEIFMRYDTIGVEVLSSTLGSTVYITSLKRDSI